MISIIFCFVAVPCPHYDVTAQIKESTTAQERNEIRKYATCTFSRLLCNLSLNYIWLKNYNYPINCCIKEVDILLKVACLILHWLRLPFLPCYMLHASTLLFWQHPGFVGGHLSVTINYFPITNLYHMYPTMQEVVVILGAIIRMCFRMYIYLLWTNMKVNNKLEATHSNAKIFDLTLSFIIHYLQWLPYLKFDMSFSGQTGVVRSVISGNDDTKLC